MSFTDIFSAVKEGTLEDVRNFVEQNGAAVIHAKNNDGRTPLHNAAQHNPNVEILKYLVSQGADVKTKDNMDWTPLHQATLNNPNVEVLKYLVSQGADVNAKNKEAVSDLTPLHIAIFTGNIEYTKFLVSAGADVNVKSKVVGTLLFTAAMEKRIECAEILVPAGADVNAVEDDKTGHTLLHKVILLDLVEAAKFLVSAGANVEAKDKDGNTPLHIAVLADKIEAVKFLVDSAKANIEAKDNNGDTPLAKYVLCKIKDIEIIKFLVSKNADIKAENKKGETALSRALFLEDATVIECLTGRNAAEFYQSRGVAYLQKEEYDQAIDAFNKVLKLTPNDAAAYSFRGSAYAQKLEYGEALADFSEAIRLRPNNCFDYLSRGIAYKESRQNDNAMRDFEKFLDLNPDDTTISIAKNMLEELHREKQERQEQEERKAKEEKERKLREAEECERKLREAEECERKLREAEECERKRIEAEKRKKRNKIAKIVVAVLLIAGFIAYNSSDAVNNVVTSESEEPEENTFTDPRDNKTYKITIIGKQTWMAENLNYAESGECYNNEPANCQIYGKHFNWAEAKKACPSGWHLPSNAEWDALYRFTDGNSSTESPYKSETAGKYLKATKGWNSSSGESGKGEDTYGFAALPGGSYYSGYNHAGNNGYWWSASENNSKNAYYRFMLRDSTVAGWNKNSKDLLLNVRCVKD